ncbi:MAG: gfo/Idh/MocA family oxidoreductase [Verrucomicrobia bacterium]|nr:MAG: gfo/Idh/MocA family oxidoreductase [Verrucomicrobiota bacterium]
MQILGEKIRWAVIGPGGIAHKFMRDMRVVEGGEVRWIVSREMQRARAFADEWNVEHAADSLAQITESAEVDAVYIASPHHAHAAAARELLAHGKAVLCEKPLTVNAREAGELIRLSHLHQTFLMEAMWTRMLPLYQVLDRWIKEGAIGKPVAVVSQFCGLPPKDPSQRWFNPEMAGGALLDLGVYNLAMSQWALGRKPQRVTASARFAESGVDELIAATLEYDGGGYGQFICSMCASAENRLEIIGDKGSIRVPGNFIQAEKAGRWADGEFTSCDEPMKGEGFVHEIEEMQRCMREGAIESPLMPHADTLATMEVMDEIRRQIGLHYANDDLG